MAYEAKNRQFNVTAYGVRDHLRDEAMFRFDEQMRKKNRPKNSNPTSPDPKEVSPSIDTSARSTKRTLLPNDTKTLNFSEYDFGIKNFLEKYSLLLPEHLKRYFGFLGELHYDDTMALFGSYINYVRELQQELRLNADALKDLEEIKFKLRMAYAIHAYQEKFEYKRLVVSKTEMPAWKLNKPFLESLEVMVKSESPVALPDVLVVETEAEKALMRKINKYKARRDKQRKRLDSMTVSATMETEEEFTVVESVQDKLQREVATLGAKSSFREDSASNSRKFSLNWTPFITEDLQRSLRIKIENKGQEKKKADDDVKRLESQMQSEEEKLAGFKNAISNLFDEVPEGLDRTTLDAARQTHINSDSTEKQKISALRSAAKMGFWDRVRVFFGRKPSAEYQAREANVNKYFKRCDLKADVEKNLLSGREGLLRWVGSPTVFDDPQRQRFDGLAQSYRNSKKESKEYEIQKQDAVQKSKSLEKEIESLNQELYRIGQPKAGEVLSPDSQSLSQ